MATSRLRNALRATAWIRKHRRWLSLPLIGVLLVLVLALFPIREIGDFVDNHNGAIVALATLAVAAFTGTLWWTSKSTLSHLRREFEATHRPWIPPDIQLASGWTWTPDGDGQVTLRFTLQNIGSSPATNVDVRTRIFPLGWGFLSPPEAQKSLSQSERRDPIAPGEGMGWTIFPNSPPRILDITMSISAADLEKSRLAFKAEFPEINITTVHPIIVGCITYRFIGEQHQTGFIVELSRIDIDKPHLTFVLDPVQGNIPIGRLRLSDYHVGSAVID